MVAIDVVVAKFGGSVLRSCRGFVEAARVVRELVGSGHDVVVVVSAVKGVTDLLLEAVERGGEGVAETVYRVYLEASSCLGLPAPMRRELEGLLRAGARSLASLVAAARLARGDPVLRDAVAGFGELLSSVVMSYALAAQGLRGYPLHGGEAGVVTDSSHGFAKPIEGAGERLARRTLLSLLSSGFVPVVAGYVGLTPNGVPTTLGRGGSDYTATLLASFIGAREVRLYTSVDGILSGDPRIVDNPVTVPLMSYGEASEVARLGLVKTHPRAFDPVAESGVPVRVLRPGGRRCTLVSRRSGPEPVKTVIAVEASLVESLVVDEQTVAAAYLAGLGATIVRGRVAGAKPVDLVALVGSGVDEPDLVARVARIVRGEGGRIVLPPVPGHTLAAVVPPGHGPSLARRLHEEVVRPWLTGSA